MNKQRILAEPTRLAKIVENWRDNVRGVDVAIDQVHDPDKGAAGWVRDLRVAPSTSNPGKQALFAQVEWTPLGKELVGGGIFRYMSAEFGPHTDPETGAEHLDVLYASTLTNRPFVKGMAAVTLESEWVEILREGDYLHDMYGQLSIQADEGDVGWLRKFYRLIEAWRRAGEPAVTDEAKTVEFATKTEDGVEYPASAYLYVPDSDAPSTWKLRIKERVDGEIRVTREQLGRAAAALSPGGFRGNRVELPGGEVAKLKAKLRALYREIGVEDKDLPPHIKGEEVQDMDKLIELLKELGVELAEGADPVDALREYLAKQKETVTTLEEKQAKLTTAETETAQLAKTVKDLEVKLAAQERTTFMDEMVRQGKLLPAERPHFEELYKSSKETVCKLLGERAPKVDLEEHGTEAAKAVPEEKRRLDELDKLIKDGMDPVAAYKQSHRAAQ